MNVLLLGLAFSAVVAAQHPLDEYNVVWNSPSRDSSVSMPTGNGDIGLNVWMEESGDLLFYISKTDAWSEAGRLLKLGRVRVRLTPNPFASGGTFRQTLKLRTGEIVIQGGKSASEATLAIWVDANNPAIRVEVQTRQPTELQVIYERWRDQQRLLEGEEIQSAYGLEGGPQPIVSYGDSIHLDSQDSVIWYHRNTKSIYPYVAKQQGLTEIMPPASDPLLNRTFGVGMKGAGLTRMNSTTLRSITPASKHAIDLYALTEIANSSEEWVARLNALITRLAPMKIDARRALHEKWWSDFWDRSYIRVTGGDEQRKVSQGYALQRFINACAGRGAFPIKFNGSIFTTDTKVGESTFDADYRRMGGPYWFQNTRLIYWPMLASGDFELMQPFFRMFLDNLLIAQRRTKLYFSHEGIFYPEMMNFWGTYASSSYGWKRDGKPLSYVENPSLRYYFSNNLELLALMREYVAFRDDKQFARASLAPIAEGIIQFYEKHYELDADGKLRIAPAQSLDVWHDAINPLPEIAGLKYVLGTFATDKLPLSKQAANTAKRILQSLPNVPTTDTNGVKVLAAAERVFGGIKSKQNPELYAIFPYRLYGAEKQELELAVKTFQNRGFKDNPWQDAIYAAFLGLASTAKDLVAVNLFCNFDWTRDQDRGSAAMLALQTMLLQSDGEKLFVAPAWPKDWDVEFKLHAPGGTVVEGAIKQGKFERVKATPEKRLADVKRLDPQ